MSIREIEAKSILRKHKRLDSWFVSCYGMNLYRGCLHNCVYCDGRAEKYQVEGEFGQDVAVKINAIDLLHKELDPQRKRKPLRPCFLNIGGGVGDGYQPIEEKYELTRQTLQLAYEFDYPVQILTKSTLVKRDIDILKKINNKNRTLVNFSFSSVNKEISGIFEPGVPSPQERLEVIRQFKSEGISCGMFLMPVIPFITDKPQIMEESIKQAKEAGVDYIIFSGMTLKEGRQEEYFYKVLEENYPDMMVDYQNIYKKTKWGNATPEYYSAIHRTFDILASKYKMPKRMPLAFFGDILNENDRVMVILEHIDYLLKLKGQKSPYGFAAYSVSQVKEPLSKMKWSLKSLKGVGNVTERIIREILETGSCSYYHKLMM